MGIVRRLRQPHGEAVYALGLCTPIFPTPVLPPRRLDPLLLPAARHGGRFCPEAFQLHQGDSDPTLRSEPSPLQAYWTGRQFASHADARLAPLCAVVFLVSTWAQRAFTAIGARIRQCLADRFPLRMFSGPWREYPRKILSSSVVL